MGTVRLDCGHVIPEASYPCPSAGRLLWESEDELQSERARRAVAEFLEAAGRGRGEEWARRHFGEDYPPAECEAEVIGDIYAVAFEGRALGVYLCPDCGSLYVRRRPCGGGWDRFERVS